MNSPTPADQQDEQLQLQSHSRSDLKAQEDLLALKVLADPHFLERVPNLRPVQPLEPGPRPAASEASLEADQAMKALSDEVQLRVFEAIERLLPELIASTLADVMQEWSQSDAAHALDHPHGK